MGNTWKGISEEKLVEAEEEMLKFSHIPIGDFERKNVYIDEENYIRTIQVGQVSTFNLTNMYSLEKWGKACDFAWIWWIWGSLL